MVGKLLIGFSLISDSLFIVRQKRLQKSRENNPNFKGKGSDHHTQGGGEGVQQKQVCPISHTNRIKFILEAFFPLFRKVPFRRKSEKSPLSAEEKKDFMGAVNNPKNRKMPSHIGEKVSRKCSTPKK